MLCNRNMYVWTRSSAMVDSSGLCQGSEKGKEQRGFTLLFILGITLSVHSLGSLCAKWSFRRRSQQFRIRRMSCAAPCLGQALKLCLHSKFLLQLLLLAAFKRPHPVASSMCTTGTLLHHCSAASAFILLLIHCCCLLHTFLRWDGRQTWKGSKRRCRVSAEDCDSEE